MAEPAIKYGAGFRPAPSVNLLEWANEYFELPRETTAEYGRYRSSRTPFVEEILKELSPDSSTQVIILIKPAQLAGTTIAIIFLIGTADLYPAPSLAILPDEIKAKSFSKKKLMPSVRLIPQMDKINASESSNTILEKTFPGGSWLLTGSHSGSSYRAESIRYLIIDDFDAIEIDIEGEGAPEKLADRRTGTFSNRKIFINSTPTRGGMSNIERAYEPTTKGKFYVPCPICGHYQYLEWGGVEVERGIKFIQDENKDILEIWYQCECCKGKIDESEKQWMLENGIYIHEFPDRAAKGYKYNALITPLGLGVNTWSYIAKEFLEAVERLRMGDPGPYITWLNTFMAETYTPKSKSSREQLTKLKDDRAGGQVPLEGVLGLTGGIDTQDNGFFYVIRAWGANYESWLIRHGFIDTFEALEMIILLSSYSDANNVQYPVLFSLQDAMGHRTKEVYDFVRERQGVMASQGVNSMAAKATLTKIDQYPGTNKPIPGGVKMLRVNTTYYKNYLANKISIKPEDPGAFHLNSEIGDDYLNHMTAEFINQKGVWECPVHRANHYWDCEVLALTAADYIGLPYYNQAAMSAGRPKPRRPRPKPQQTTGRRINPWRK